MLDENGAFYGVTGTIARHTHRIVMAGLA